LKETKELRKYNAESWIRIWTGEERAIKDITGTADGI